MHIIITRPKEDSFHLIKKLINSGHTVTHLPVMKIEQLETDKVNLKNYKAIIFTSSNAIRFMNLEKVNSKIKCFCVGKTTEFNAKKAGFINVYSSEAEALIHSPDAKINGRIYNECSSFFLHQSESRAIKLSKPSIKISSGI